MNENTTAITDKSLEHSRDKNAKYTKKCYHTECHTLFYSITMLKKEERHHQQPCDSTTRIKKHYSSILRLPYVNDAFNARARKILTRNGLDGVRIANPRPVTLQQLAARQPSQEPCKICKCPVRFSQVENLPDSRLCVACTKSNVVYQAICSLCTASYIGSTTLAIHTRTRQHIYIIKRREVEKSALAEHYVEQHPDNTAEPNINFCAVATTREELRLLIEKAYWIQRPKPALNRKQDNMGTGFLV